MPPGLRPPSGRPGHNTHCDVLFQVAGIPVYGEVKRFPDPWLRERVISGGKYELRPIDLYSKLRDVPAQFPEGTLNLVFVFHRSFNDRETLQQALFGWREALRSPASPELKSQENAGLFRREEWRDVSGCCLCRVEASVLRYRDLSENPRARTPLPPKVYSALIQEAAYF